MLQKQSRRKNSNFLFHRDVNNVVDMPTKPYELNSILKVYSRGRKPAARRPNPARQHILSGPQPFFEIVYLSAPRPFFEIVYLSAPRLLYVIITISIANKRLANHYLIQLKPRS